MYNQSEKEDIRKILSISQKFDLSKRDAARVVYAELSKKPQTFKTEIGNRFKRSLMQIISGKSTYLSCAVCGNKTQGRFVICGSCSSRLQGKPPIRSGTQATKGNPASKSESYFCQVCGHPIDGLAEICMKCGCSPTNGHEYCCNCGNKVNTHSSYCMKCGCIPTRKVVTRGKGEASGKDMVKFGLKIGFWHVIHWILDIIIVILAVVGAIFHDESEVIMISIIGQIIIGALAILVALMERRIFRKYNSGTQWFIIVDAFFYFAMMGYILIQEEFFSFVLPIVGFAYIMIGKKKVL